MTKNLQRAAGKMPGGQELKEKKRNLVPVIVAEHNLVSNVSTSQVAKSWPRKTSGVTSVLMKTAK